MIDHEVLESRETAGNRVLLSMGSNTGDRQRFLREALNQFELHAGIVLKAVSSIYETDPVGFLEQSPFYNIVVELETTLAPLDLLRFCQHVEKLFLRERTIQWGPRTLDIDLLTYQDLTMDTEELTLPHPRMHEREFVLLPLKELETGEVQVSSGVRPVLRGWYPLSV